MELTVVNAQCSRALVTRLLLWEMISGGLWLGCQPWVPLDYIEPFESNSGVKMLM